MRATDILVREHDLILRGIHVLEAMARRANNAPPVPAGDARAIIEFTRTFADGCHHAKEEGVLFPAMEAAGVSNEGGPIGVMVAAYGEHEANVDASGAYERYLAVVEALELKHRN